MLMREVSFGSGFDNHPDFEVGGIRRNSQWAEFGPADGKHGVEQSEVSVCWNCFILLCHG